MGGIHSFWISHVGNIYHQLQKPVYIVGLWEGTALTRNRRVGRVPGPHRAHYSIYNELINPFQQSEPSCHSEDVHANGHTGICALHYCQMERPNWHLITWDSIDWRGKFLLGCVSAICKKKKKKEVFSWNALTSCHSLSFYTLIKSLSPSCRCNLGWKDDCGDALLAREVWAAACLDVLHV